MSLKADKHLDQDTPFECPSCLKKFTYHYRLKQHERNRHKITNFRSTTKSLKKALSSLKHFQHQDRLRPLTNPFHPSNHRAQLSQGDLGDPLSEERGVHVCGTCDSTFSSFQQLINHRCPGVSQLNHHDRKRCGSFEQNLVNNGTKVRQNIVKNSVSSLKICKKTRRSSYRQQLTKLRHLSCKENEHKIEFGKDLRNERKNIFESLSESCVMKLSTPFADAGAGNNMAEMDFGKPTDSHQIPNRSSSAIKCFQLEMNVTSSELKANNKRPSSTSSGLKWNKKRHTLSESNSSLMCGETTKSQKVSPCRTPTQTAHRKVMKKYQRLRSSMNSPTRIKHIHHIFLDKRKTLRVRETNHSFESEFLKSIGADSSGAVREIDFDSTETSHESMDIPSLQHYESSMKVDSSYRTMPDLNSPEIDTDGEADSRPVTSDMFTKISNYSNSVCEKSYNFDLKDTKTDFSSVNFEKSHSNELESQFISCADCGKLEENNNSDVENKSFEGQKGIKSITSQLGSNGFEQCPNLNETRNSLLDSSQIHSDLEALQCSKTDTASRSENMECANGEDTEKFLSSPVHWQQQFLSFITESVDGGSSPTHHHHHHNKTRKRAKRSNVCSCCRLAATPGKKKTHKHHRVGRPRKSECPVKYNLPPDHEEFSKDTARLLNLRNKVYRLLCNLFPRCLTVLESVDPESEKVEVLIDEIIGNLEDVDYYSATAMNSISVSSPSNMISKPDCTYVSSHTDNQCELNSDVDHSLLSANEDQQSIPSPTRSIGLSTSLKENVYSSLSPTLKTDQELICCVELEDAEIDRNVNSNMYSETSDYFSEQNSTSPDYENLSQNSGSPGTEVICRDYRENLDHHKMNQELLKHPDEVFIERGSDTRTLQEQRLEDATDTISLVVPDCPEVTRDPLTQKHSSLIREGNNMEKISFETNNLQNENSILSFESTFCESKTDYLQNVNSDPSLESVPCESKTDYLRKDNSVQSLESTHSESNSSVVVHMGTFDAEKSKIRMSAVTNICPGDFNAQLKQGDSYLEKDNEEDIKSISDVKIVLCKKPNICLENARTKILTLIRVLLPELPIEKYSRPEDLEYVVDLLTEANKY